MHTLCLFDVISQRVKRKEELGHGRPDGAASCVLANKPIIVILSSFAVTTIVYVQFLLREQKKRNVQL